MAKSISPKESMPKYRLSVAINFLKVKYHHSLLFAPALVIQRCVEILIVLENVPKTA
jgi:hypothetical protein